MSTTTLEREVVITAAAPLTESEQDSLIAIAASAQKTERRKTVTRTRGSRAWSLGGNVD